MKSFQLHPLCTLFPRLTGNEFAALVADIKVNGLREPITLHDGLILDGGNRFRACHEAGIEPHFREFEGESIADYVRSMNFHRRHLTPGQAASIVSLLQDWERAQEHGGDRKSDQEVKKPLDSVADRAKKSGTSQSTQKQADKVAKADPELAKEVAQGTTTLPKALKKVNGSKPSMPKPEPEYDPKEDELASAHETVVALAAENDALKDRLAVEVMPGTEDDRTAALNTITELRTRIRTLELELDAVKSSRDTYMRECGAMKKQMAMQRKEIEKLKGDK